MPKLERFQSKGAEFWQQVKQDWQTASQAGSTITAFCTQRGLAPDTFNKKLRRWREEAQTAQAAVLMGAPLPGKASGRNRRTGKGGEGGLNAASLPPLHYLPPQHSPGKPSTVAAQEAIEAAAQAAALNLVRTIQTGGAVGLKASVEVLERAGVLRAKEQSKSTPYAELTEEQLRARLQLLAPDALRPAQPAEAAQ